MPTSPAAAPCIRNCSAMVVLPVPGLPSRRCSRLRAIPPSSTKSRPEMPVLALGKVWLQVLLVTGLIGGGAAALAGRAIAATWRPFWHICIYMALLGAAVRFVHFALFEAALLAPGSYAVETPWLL